MTGSENFFGTGGFLLLDKFDRSLVTDAKKIFSPAKTQA